MALSERGKAWADLAPTLTIWEVVKNLWDPSTNPNGYVNLGVAENALMHTDMLAYVRRHRDLPMYGLTYGDGGSGCRRIRQTLARFVSFHFKTVTPVEAEHVTITNGVSAANEHITNLIADSGDVILLGRPHYGAFVGDIQLRTGVHCIQVSFGDIDPLSENAVQVYEAAVAECKEKGRRVAGIFLCNPHNPLGRCYPRSTIIKLMQMCQKHQIHLISDEIYALTVWRTPNEGEEILSDVPALEPFTSVLSISTTSDVMIDPALIHVLWGLSKDFGANGLRLGCIISQHNPSAQAAMVPVSKYSYASSLVEHLAATMLDDDAFMTRYLAENRQKLLEHFVLVRDWLDKNKIEYAKGANAAFFFWVNLGDFYLRKCALHDRQGLKSPCDNPDFDLDTHINGTLLKERVFLASGTTFGSEKPGWFRIVFSVPRVLLEEGLARVITALTRELSG